MIILARIFFALCALAVSRAIMKPGRFARDVDAALRRVFMQEKEYTQEPSAKFIALFRVWCFVLLIFFIWNMLHFTM